MAGITANVDPVGSESLKVFLVSRQSFEVLHKLIVLMMLAAANI